MWKNKPGYFITFEGPEGGGKTSQIPGLIENLKEKGIDVLVTREPGGTSIGDQIREVLMNLKNVDMSQNTEVLLFQAARAQHVDEILNPALKRDGKLVICDRFVDSTLAYQGFGQQRDIAVLNGLITFATAGLKPDLTVLFDLDVVRGIERKQRSTEWTRLDAYAIQFHKRVRDGYLSLVQSDPERWIVIDALKSKEEVAKDLQWEIMTRLEVDGYMEGNRRGVER